MSVKDDLAEDCSVLGCSWMKAAKDVKNIYALLYYHASYLIHIAPGN